MKKWISRTFLVAIVGWAGYSAYVYYKAGLWNRPPVPEGSFWISFKDGTRVIVSDVPNERDTRKYIIRPRTDVPSYFKDAWSFCDPPTLEDAEAINKALPPGPGMRLEAECVLDADGEIIPTGYLYSAPKL